MTPSLAPLAIIADTHGNFRALEAVLADAARADAGQIINLGDNANGPLDPAACVHRLRELRAVHVRGNGDRVTGGCPGARPLGSAQFARERLDEEALAWLRGLATVAQDGDWMAFHATPHSDEAYLLENPSGGGVIPATPEEIAARVDSTHARLLLCGHTHVPRLVRMRDGRTIVNPGSVGLPAYEDTEPVPHRVETGAPHARYALAYREANEWRIELRAVPYDWDAAARDAERAGWPAWAAALRTGYWRG